MASMARVTLQSIADRVGVSRMTVSNAFSRPDQLSAGLRERILSAAEELGYSGPDPAARALARGRTGSVGLLLTDRLSVVISDALGGEFVAAVSDELADHGMATTLLAPTQPDGVVEGDVAMDGLLVYICGSPQLQLEWARRRGLPIVTVDQRPIDGLPSVNVDDRTGARLGAQHLVDLGHRRIGILTLAHEVEADRDAELVPAHDRMAGWRDVLDPLGIEPLVGEGVYLASGPSYAAARELLDRTDRPTGVLCVSDAFALEVLRAAADLGLRVPEDVSVVGYDDSRIASLARPPLTTIRQDVATKARLAVAALVRAINNPDSGAPERELLPAELVVRESTAAPPG
jgi:DNA-binding LacI/PurR family transcriptional regulator